VSYGSKILLLSPLFKWTCHQSQRVLRGWSIFITQEGGVWISCNTKIAVEVKGQGQMYPIYSIYKTI